MKLVPTTIGLLLASGVYFGEYFFPGFFKQEVNFHSTHPYRKVPQSPGRNLSTQGLSVEPQ